MPTVADLYDPELVRAAGHRLADLLGEHFTRVQNRETPVLNWRHPAENVADAANWLNAPPLVPKPVAVAERFAELVRMTLERGQNLHSPRYVGHQVPPSLPLAALFTAVADATNQAMAIYEMGPWTTAVEVALIARLGAKLGYAPGTFSGLVTHGGSLANLTALLTARNVALADSWEAGTARDGPPPVLIAHAEAHYCIARAAGILGLGTAQVVKPPLDDRRRMDPRALRQTLVELKAKGHPIIAVAACVCATPIGAFDPLEQIADVCEEQGVWLHADAAHGGAVAFSDRHRHLLAGVQRADSVVWDAHKMLFVPALCTFLFYKNKQHCYETFRQEAPYLFDPSDPGLTEYDSGLRTLECTKRGAALGLWGLWSLFGEGIFGELVDAMFDLAQTLHQKLTAAADFMPLHEPQCNIVVFRHLPQELQDASPETLGRFQLALRQDVVRSGSYYLVPTSKDGVAALRCTVINPLTTPADLDGLLDELRQRGRALLPTVSGG